VLNNNYVLITAARNEEKYIEATIKSVLSQTILPQKWVIVSDGSTDHTDEIIKKYLTHSNFIEFVRRDPGSNQNSDFASKVFALNAGYERLKDLLYDYIGHLDADITFEPDYYENVLKLFEQNPLLGIAGGYIFEPVQGNFVSRPYNTERSVAGGIQLFRRECYENIGGFIPLQMGGEDTYAEVMARMKGWKVASFKEIIVHHHKIGSLMRGKIRDCFRKGMVGYSLGSHPLFECVKCIRRVGEKPHLIGAFVRMCGFVWPSISKQHRLVSTAFIKYLRAEQLALLKSFLYQNFRRILYK
jgi:glycosyltransferase involved in cell wall biosynthesis